MRWRVPTPELLKKIPGHPGDVEIFQHENFNTRSGDESGWRFRTALSVSDLGEYNDQASSVIIYSGIWEFCEHFNFNLDGDVPGYAIRLGPGYYASLDAMGITQDTLSSFHQVG